MKNFILYLWQLPQNLIGLLILLFIKGEVKHKFQDISYYFYDPFPGGISLGNYLILGSNHSQTIRHEHGHAIQSRMLGSLYGWIIPSTKNGYYKFYTEKWADKLVNIVRK